MTLQRTHHGNDPMDGIGGTIKNRAYRNVFYGDVAVDTPKKFAEFANEIAM